MFFLVGFVVDRVHRVPHRAATPEASIAHPSALLEVLHALMFSPAERCQVVQHTIHACGLPSSAGVGTGGRVPVAEMAVLRLVSVDVLCLWCHDALLDGGDDSQQETMVRRMQDAVHYAFTHPRPATA